MADAPKPDTKLGPNALFALLEEGLDDLVARFRAAAPTEPTAGEFHLDKEATHKLTGRLISVTSKLHALEKFCGGSLRQISIARTLLGDPITDAEIAEHTVRAGKFPGIVPTEEPARPTDDVMRPADAARPQRPAVAPDGKPWN